MPSRKYCSSRDPGRIAASLTRNPCGLCRDGGRFALRQSFGDNERVKATIAAVLAVLLTVVPALAAKKPTVSPDSVIAALYKDHDAKRGPFYQTEKRAAYDRYFVKALADLIWADLHSAGDEVGAIDGDPLYDAQDMKITDFTIHKPSYDRARARVIVSFRNFNEPRRVIYYLQRDGSRWKIEDIEYADGSTLMKNLRSTLE